MLLQKLVEYAERLELPPTLYALAPIRYVIEIDSSGRVLNPEPTDQSDAKNPRQRRGLPYLVPQLQRAFGIQPLLFADNAEYTLGLAREKSKPERVVESHTAYRQIVGRCAAATGEPAVAAIAAFLEADPAGHLRLDDTFDRGAAITFRVDGVLPVDLPSVRAFWAAEHDPGAESTDGKPPRIMQCLVCGESRPVLDRLQGKIKSIPGGQPSGTAIISANAAAFESYGLSASLVAPTCASCGERFTKAANALLADERSNIRIGPGVFIFWTREPVTFNLRSDLATPQPEQVEALIASVRTGRARLKLDDTAFYGALLSGSGGRAVVRDWIDTTVGEVERHLGRWFVRQRIVGDWGEAPRPLGLFALAASTVREASDLSAPTLRALLRAALTSTPLSMDLLAAAVRRGHAEQRVTRARAALIKLVLLSQDNGDQEDVLVQLDTNNSDGAYRCGRLLALLEEAQRAAIPGIKGTVVDRFYGTASTAPRLVFPRLLSGLQAHMSKLGRDRPRMHRRLQRQLEDVQFGMSRFPTVLTLDEQGRFALGYYHQRAENRAAAQAAKAARQAAGVAPSDLADELDSSDGTPDV